MKKYFTVLLILLSASVLNADEIYNSNILGMKLGRINSAAEAETGYYLRMNLEAGVKYERLFEDGVLQFTRTLKDDNGISTIITVTDDQTETVIRENGVITSEKIEGIGKPVELTVYSYRNNKLEYTDYFSAGELVYRDEYFYTDNGRLLDVSRKYSDSSILNASFFFVDGRLSRYLFKNGDQRNYIKFDRKGIVFSDAYGAGTLNETRTYGNLDDGGRFELIRNTSTGASTKLEFNSSNRIISSIIKNEKGITTEETLWRYKADLLTEMKIKRALSLEVFNYEYDDEGKALRETYSKNGNIIQLTEYSGDNDYTVELYRFGIPVLRIKYKDGVRVTTDQLQEE
jgi:hypothetical protein